MVGIQKKIFMWNTIPTYYITCLNKVHQELFLIILINFPMLGYFRLASFIKRKN